MSAASASFGGIGWILALIGLLLVGGSFIGVVILWVMVIRRKSVDGLARCGACGYAVRGITSLICVECGADLREVGIKSARSGAMVRPWVFLLVWCLCFPIIALVLSTVLLGVGPQVTRATSIFNLEHSFATSSVPSSSVVPPSISAQSIPPSITRSSTSSFKIIVSGDWDDLRSNFGGVNINQRFSSSNSITGSASGVPVTQTINANLPDVNPPTSITVSKSHSSFQQGRHFFYRAIIDPATLSYQWNLTGSQPNQQFSRPFDVAAAEQWLIIAGFPANDPDLKLIAAELGVLVRTISNPRTTNIQFQHTAWHTVSSHNWSHSYPQTWFIVVVVFLALFGLISGIMVYFNIRKWRYAEPLSQE